MLTSLLILAGIFNCGGGFAVKPFLDFTEQDFRSTLDTQA
jgi:hypothetical protein